MKCVAYVRTAGKEHSESSLSIGECDRGIYQ